MLFENGARKGRSLTIRRAWLFCLLLALPTLVLAGIIIYQQKFALAPALLLLGGSLLYLLLVAAALIDVIVRPVQTLSSVVSALREGNYSFRARSVNSLQRAGRDAFSDLAFEINALADLFQQLRVHSLEAAALLARIIEVMDAPLFAFDRNDRLQLANEAGVQLLGRPHAQCFGRTARELGLEELLAAPDQTTHSFGSKANRWLLRKTAFRQDGAPHSLLLLADVSLLLQNEEQAAWKRLIRVLGHELSNSLTPIKSIAGSLLSRVEHMDGEDAALNDLSRGLGIIESRADSLHRFVQSYRQLAQLPPPQLRQVPLGPLLKRAVLLQQGKLPDQHLLIQIDPGPPVALTADPDQLEQMFINLLANAVDAALTNGAPPIRVSWKLAGDVALVSIEDRGLGIANAENLFVPFYTTKPSGSGVGLTLAQQIARVHGGEVLLSNREDGPGVRATIRLPVAMAVPLTPTL